MEMIRLPDVTLACALDVGGDGPLVLMQHGFPDDASTFDRQVPALVAAGFRVARPTLRGYGPGERAASGEHHAIAAGEDLLALADRLSPGRPVHLVGHDWGAIAAFHAAQSAPHRVARLVSMSVPHPAAMLRKLASIAQLRRSWYMAYFQLPGTERALAADDFALVDRFWREWSPGFRMSAADIGRVKSGLRGREDAALAYYRALRSPAVLRRALLAFRPITIPALHLHGDRDGCIGVDVAIGAERFYAGLYALERLPGAGHFMTRERPDAVARILVRFLTEARS